MEHPQSPTVPPSEPEKEQNVVEEVLKQARSSGTRAIYSVAYIRDALREEGLDVDDEGFIIDTESKDYVKPYGYSQDAFREIPSPVDDPLSEYMRPQEETLFPTGSKDRLHLSDLHSIREIDGRWHPIEDDKMNLQHLFQETGMFFAAVTAWSSGRELLDEDAIDLMPMQMRPESDPALELSCLKCDHTSTAVDWIGETITEIRCPDCDCPWDTWSISTCRDCGHETWSEQLDFIGEGLHTAPKCPECGTSGYNNMSRRTRYDE